MEPRAAHGAVRSVPPTNAFPLTPGKLSMQRPAKLKAAGGVSRERRSAIGDAAGVHCDGRAVRRVEVCSRLRSSGINADPGLRGGSLLRARYSMAHNVWVALRSSRQSVRLDKRKFTILSVKHAPHRIRQ